MNAYLDSSALLKLLLGDEDGDDDLRAEMDLVGQISTSRLTYVEALAALAAARRSGRVGRADYEVAVGYFERIWSSLEIIELTTTVAGDAAIAAETYGLRAGDAIQLASARTLDASVITLIAWDARLRTAAVASGLPCYPPEV
jgi:predicted nucleic acid-binding protein